MDSSSNGFGAALFNGEKLVSMYSNNDPCPFQHSSASEVEGLVRTLRAMRFFLLGRQFVVYTNNWLVLRMLRGKTIQDLVLCRLEESMNWYPKIKFISEKENGIENILSRCPMHTTKVRTILKPKELVLNV